MTKFKNTYRIESARLSEWDYSNPWWYYITVNTKKHIEWFGRIVNEEMKFNELGFITNKCWSEIPEHFPDVQLDYFIVMPNHIHGIIVISSLVETRHASSLRNKTISLSNVVGSFKSAVSKQAHENGFNNFSWHARFYDRIIER
ncbi:MAG: transposase, partial [Melioribacteraceae bacterium]